MFFLFSYFYVSGFQVSEEDDDKNCHMDTVAQCITGFAYVAADTSMAITCR